VTFSPTLDGRPPRILLEGHHTGEAMDHRWLHRMAAAGLVLAACVAPPAGAAAKAIEEFDGPPSDEWYLDNATVADGALRIDEGGRAMLPVVGPDLDARIVLGRRGDGVAWVAYRWGGEDLALIRIGEPIEVLVEVGGEVVADFGSSLPVPPGEDIILGIEAHGAHHLISVDDRPLIEFDFEGPGGEALGFIADRGAALVVDRLEWTSGPDTPEPPAADAPPPGELEWIRTGGPLGGLGYDVRMRPDDPDTMLVTDAFAGVFASTDGGANWEPSNDGITVRTGATGDSIPVFCLTIDPHDPDVVWAGAQYLRGIFRSNDGGRTWQEMDRGVVEQEGITFRGFTVDPGDSEVVYAAAEISSWAGGREPREGREFDMVSGVVYRSTDRGENWTPIWRGDDLARYVWVDPTDSNILYVSTGIFDREAANSDPERRIPGGVGVVKSTDGGRTWSEANRGLGNLYVGSLFMHPEDPDVLLAGTGNNQYWEGNGAYLTTDGASSWERTLSGETITSVEFALSDPDVAYAASPESVYRSDDRGHTWTRVAGGENGWGPPGVRAGFPIDLQVDPRDPDRLFVNNYGGGNFVSADGGRTWEAASRGYTGAQVRDIAVDPTAPGRVFVAARSGIFTTRDGGETWEGIAVPPEAVLEWNAVAIDPSNPAHLVAGNNWDPVLLESTDRGATWHPRTQPMGEGAGPRVFAFAPSNPAVVYAGTGGYRSAGSWSNEYPGRGLLISIDGGRSWRSSPDPMIGDAHVAAIAVHPERPEHALAATTNLGLVATDDGGESWRPLSPDLPDGATAVAFHPRDPNVVIAGFELAGVYRSLDGGATWQRSSAGLNPEALVSDIAGSPDGTVYLSDLLSGVYRSEDGGATWSAVNRGLRTRAVTALAVGGGGLHVYAATDGEGVYRLDLDGKPPEPVSPSPSEPEAEEPPVVVTSSTVPRTTAAETTSPASNAAAPPPAPAGPAPPGTPVGLWIGLGAGTGAVGLLAAGFMAVRRRRGE